MANQPASACDYFYLEPVAKHSLSPVAQLQLWSREAKKRGGGGEGGGHY